VVIDNNGRADPAATKEKRRRMGDGPVVTPFDFGSQRRAWEMAFDDSTQERVTARLLELPGPLRQTARRALFAGVEEPLLGDPAAGRLRLMDILEEMN
jgi:hypothetical protein